VLGALEHDPINSHIVGGCESEGPGPDGGRTVVDGLVELVVGTAPAA
jgi:hypothetical protein